MAANLARMRRGKATHAMTSNQNIIKLALGDWLKIAGFLVVQVGGLVGYAETRLTSIESRLTVLETRRASDVESDAKTMQILARIESSMSQILDQFHSVDKRLTVIESRRLAQGANP